MDRPSNPFALRTTENIDSDELFLKLFSTEPMRKLQKQNDEGKLWHFVTYIQSPPGFGKTSLLRIFHPTVLKKIVSHNKDMRDVFETLNKLGVKDKNRIKRCAVYLLTRSDYALIDDEDGEGPAVTVMFTLLRPATDVAVLAMYDQEFDEDGNLGYSADVLGWWAELDSQERIVVKHVFRGDLPDLSVSFLAEDGTRYDLAVEISSKSGQLILVPLPPTNG